MPVSNENFDQLKIDRLKHFLEDMATKGQPRPYEIFVDSLKVIPKTEDPKDFDSYEHYLSEDTEKIRILIYNTPSSPRNDQYCFYMQKNGQARPLNGLGDIESIVQEKLTARDREHEMTRLKEELADTKKQLEEAEEYAEELEQQLEETKSNKFKLGNINMGEFASVMLEGFVRRNPQMLAKIPGGETLAGIIEQDTAEKEKKQLQPTADDAEASFKKKTGEGLTEDQKRYIGFLSQLEHVFNEPELEILMKVIQKLSEQPARLKEVTQLLNIENN